jgi:GNAT superfamily N-acetyltransferase
MDKLRTPSSAYSVSLEENPSEEDLNAVQGGLMEFNRLHGAKEDYRRLTVFVRGPDGKVAGGLLGETYWGWLHVAILWLEENIRRWGYGTRLMDLAEQEAARRGCRAVHLDTMSFQALPFYRKRGYQVFGELQDMPPGQRRIFLYKKLD